MAEIYIFCFPIFFPNMSGISGSDNHEIHRGTAPVGAVLSKQS